MPISRTGEEKFGLAVLFNNVKASHSFLDEKPYDDALINIGGGYGNINDGGGVQFYDSRNGEVDHWDHNPWFGTNFGEWTIVPNRNFVAEVKLWGAGGGSHGHGGNSYAGGGGYAKGDILFLEGIPYTFWVGQGGFYSQGRYSTNGNRYNYRTSGTFGNGGGGGHNAGSGGGLSGIFFNTLGFESQGSGHNSQGHSNNTEVGGVNTWFRTPSQNNALLVAGGGGGAGHSNTSHHGQGGGGGGTTGRNGHNSGGGSQTGGGSGGYNSAQAGHQLHGGWGGNNSHGGGGGGGWYGGGGGGHSGSHYNGGGGGSGHSLELNSVSGYRNYWIKEKYGDLVFNSYMEQSPSQHGTYVNMAAGRTNADWGYAGLGAGTANHNSNNNDRKWIGFWQGWRTGMNGRIVMRVKE